MKLITEDGYEFKVGDVIIGEHAFGCNKYEITRVTNKYAFSKVNDSYEAKFKRVYKSFGFQPLPRESYNTIRYKVYSI